MELAFRKSGQGQPLIILHGLFGQSDNWNTLAKRFGENGFEVFTIDLRNHGLSPHSENWSYSIMAEDLQEFVEKHKLKNPILMGHSMGGKVAMFFALNYDHQLDKLIICDISPRAYEPHHDNVLEALMAVDFDKVATRKEVEAVLSNYIQDYGTKQFLLKNIYWEDSSTSRMNWRFNLKVIAAQYAVINVEAPAKTSEVNTLVLRGGKSNYVTEKDKIDFERRFPNYQLITIADSGHWIHAEQPETFYKEVIRFIG
jgi:esterase